MGELFSVEDIDVLAPLVLNEKSRAEKEIFRMKTVDPEWNKYLETLNGLINKLKKMKE